MNPKREPQYAALLKASAEHGYPVRFKTDLTRHDRTFLYNQDPKEPFLWCLRPTGTHVVMIKTPEQREGRAVRRFETRASEYVGMIESAFQGEECLWFMWDGLTLTKFQDGKCAREWARAIESMPAGGVDNAEI